MSFRRDLAQRSSREWAVRLALAAATAVLGCLGVTFSIAQVMMVRDPALAHRLAPYDGRIAAAYATSLASDDATRGDRAQADRLAKRALLQDPTAVAAAATLGLNADVRGDKAASQRYFAFVQKLSRRDLRTQLFMIENAVQRGDVPAALHQYDITLRVFPTLSDMLYPVLASAIGNPAIRQELVKTLAGKPPWGDSFVNFAADHSPSPTSTALLFTGLRRANVAIPGTAQSGVVNALIAGGQIDAAWSYYASTRPGADRRRSRDPKFTAVNKSPSQFDWQPIDDVPGLTVSMQSGLVELAAPTGVGGALLQQRQLLPPGKYRLSGHSIGVEQADGARPYWTLRCQDGREVGRLDVPNSSVANGNFSGIFSVPAGCFQQTLVLMARPSEAVSGLSGQLDRIELAPVTK